MLNLMKLEMKKFKFGGYLRGVVIANIAIIGLLMLIYFDLGKEIPAFSDYSESFFIISLIVKGTFMIFASVLIAKLIINEYKSKTISVLFTYPIDRKKIMAAKLTLIGVITFAVILVSTLISATVFYIVDAQMQYIPDSLTSGMLIEQALNLLMHALSGAGMSLIPLFFGLRKKSVSATIVSSILIVMIVCSNNMGFSLSSIIAIPIGLAAIGIIIAYLAIRNIDKVDWV